MDINELRERRLKLIADARALVEKAEGEDRDFTTDETEQHDKIWADIESLGKRLERSEQVATLTSTEKGFTSRRVELDGGHRQEKTTESTHTEIFRRYLMGGREALSGAEYRDVSATVGAEGGFLVAPEKFINELIQGVTDKVYIRQMARIFQLKDAASLGAPAIDDPASDAEWTSELTNPAADTSLSFSKRSLVPSPLAKVIKVSEKVLRLSSLPVENIVRDLMSAKLAEAEEKAFLVGTGTNQPLGVFTASADGISTARDFATGNTATAITFDGLIEAKFGLKSQYHDTASWMFHRNAMKMISKIKDLDGQYLWEPSRQAGTPDRLLGNTVKMSEYVPSTYTTGLYAGIIGDFRYYWIAESLGITVKRLDELFAMTNQIGFIVRQEVDGMPVLEEAFARVKLG